MAAVSPVGRASGLEPLSAHADSLAVEALYQQHSRSVFAYCLSKLRRREDAEDAVQTTFLHAVRGLQRGVVPNIELAWLLGIARNVCLSRHESAGRRGRLELVCDPVDLDRAPARIGRGDELIGLQDALARLPERQRQAVLLRDWRGLSYEEVAEHLGVSLANAESLIFRGRKAVAQLLEEQPRTTRSRLAALGNLGSIAAWVKSALTGASTAAKVAAALTTVAAVSATGIAVEASTLDRPAQVPATVTTSRAPVAASSHEAALPSTQPAASVAGPKAPARAPKRTEASPARSAPDRAATVPTKSTPAAAAPTTQAPGAAPLPEQPAPSKPTVQGAAAKATAPLPVTSPSLPEPVGALPLPPVVEPVVEAVAPVVAPVTEAVAPVVEAVKPVAEAVKPVTEVLPAVGLDPKKALP